MRAALDYLEREACYVRRGHAGAEVLRAEGFAGAIYHHEMARSSDPHLHTHLVIANAARGADGRWSAPDMRAVYAAAKAAGAIQEAVLRHELTRRARGGLAAGRAVGPRAARGARGSPAALLAAQRRDHGAGHRPRLADPGRHAGHPARDARPQAVLERERAQAEWRARAAEHGFGERELRTLLGQGQAPLAGPRAARRAAPGRAPGRAGGPHREGLHLQRARGHRRLAQAPLSGPSRCGARGPGRGLPRPPRRAGRAGARTPARDLHDARHAACRGAPGGHRGAPGARGRGAGGGARPRPGPGRAAEPRPGPARRARGPACGHEHRARAGGPRGDGQDLPPRRPAGRATSARG